MHISEKKTTRTIGSPSWERIKQTSSSLSTSNGARLNTGLRSSVPDCDEQSASELLQNLARPRPSQWIGIPALGCQSCQVRWKWSWENRSSTLPLGRGVWAWNTTTNKSGHPRVPHCMVFWFEVGSLCERGVHAASYPSCYTRPHPSTGLTKEAKAIAVNLRRWRDRSWARQALWCSITPALNCYGVAAEIAELGSIASFCPRSGDDARV